MDDTILLKKIIEKLLNTITNNKRNTILLQYDILLWLLEKINLNQNFDFANINASDIINNLFPLHGGLTDYYYWSENEEERLEKNKELTHLKDELYRILKQYS
ncbi:hypothetical protein [Streptococcus marimammalium]|uniref:hypothetical protein n=1 Tax=Streptococcus marimammalium TaxID=269666 RepID=UPI00035F69D8|nr:hypothetical protein [Streptococcus marimammalium]